MSGIHVSFNANALKAYAERLRRKTDAARRELAEMGREAAQMGFDASEHTGSHDIVVTTRNSGNTSAVIAEGEQVVFTEFGTGINFPDHPLAAEFGFTHGSYGKGHGKNPKGWVFRGDPGDAAEPALRRVKHEDGSTTWEPIDGLWHTYGQPASRSMYHASQHMEDNVFAIFGRWLSN